MRSRHQCLRRAMPLTLVFAFGVCRPIGAQTVAHLPSAVIPQTVVGPSQPAESLNVLSSRVMSLETIYVQTANGQQITGRFSRASETSLTMEVDGETREILAQDVQQVWRRGANRVKQGMLVGYLGGAAIGLVGMLTSDSSDTGTSVFLSLTAAGGAGLIWGAVIGAFMHQHPLVYPDTGSSVRLLPIVGRGGAGVLASVRF
jgi:hypothetical protein